MPHCTQLADSFLLQDYTLIVLASYLRFDTFIELINSSYSFFINFYH